jgi:nitroreductase
MSISDAIFGRRAVREYTREGVDEKLIGRLLEAAVQAPSAVNAQPWTFHVVRDQSLLDRISHDAKAHLIDTASAGPHADRFKTLLSDAKFQIFYHAPVLILISAAAEGPYIVEDCALAAENLMLAAFAAGLGSCWIGFAQGYLNTPAGRKALGLPGGCVPVAPIIVGHPLVVPAPVARKAAQIHWIG